MIVGGGFGGLLAAARLREVGVERYSHHREGGRLRRHVVLESLSGCAVRHRGLHLSAAARRDRLHPEGEVLRRRDLRSRLAHRKAVQPLRSRLLPDPGQRSPLGGRPMEGDDRRDDVFRARYVIMSSGPLNRPKLPGIPGIENFKGHTFHTSRWDYDYTGGPPRWPDKLADKRVAIIGTGATPSSASRTSGTTRSNSTCSSARRPRWMSAATRRPTRNG